MVRTEQLVRGLSEPLRGLAMTLVFRPGKGLRSALVAACAPADSADPELVARLGAIVELIHLASLLHDDVVDRSPTRRGVPAAHTIVGAELATLAGLACFSLAGAEAASIGGGVEVLTSRACSGLSYGQVLDVERAFDTSLSIKDYTELVSRKTGELFQLSCLLGAAAGGTDPETIRLLGLFGLSFGIAFQIADDCLDLAAGDTGKPAGLDHLRGLFGAPTLYALAADPRGNLAELLLSPELAVDDIPAVRRLVMKLGGLDAARQLAAEHFARANEAVAAVGIQVRERVLAIASGYAGAV
jgi:geranylgeranyl pyrophosphate synthase